jgi:hypothetical protein
VLLILWVRFPSGRVVTVGEQSDGGEVTNLLEYLVQRVALGNLAMMQAETFG